MITPILLGRLAWKGYLIFMCTNFIFVPLVYFCYPETANLTLEEIDYIFADESKSSVKWSLEMRRQKLAQGIDRNESLVPGSASRRASRASAAGVGKEGITPVGVKGDVDGEGTLRGSKDEDRVVHDEKVR